MPISIHKDFFATANFSHFYEVAPDEVRAMLDAAEAAAERADEVQIARWENQRKARAEIADLTNKIYIREKEKTQFKSEGSWSDHAERQLQRWKDRRDKLAAKFAPEPEPPINKAANRSNRLLVTARSERSPRIEEWPINPRWRFKYAPAEASGHTLDSIRAAESDVLQQIVDVQRLPVTFAEAKRKIELAVSEASRAGAPNFRDVMRGGKLELPSAVKFSPDLKWSVPTELGVSFLAWLDPKTVTKRLIAGLEDAYGDVQGISASERKGRLAELDCEFLRLQRIESRLLHEAEELGDPVDIWPALHPLALFEITHDEDAPETPPREITEKLGDPMVSVPHPADTPKITVLEQPKRGRK